MIQVRAAHPDDLDSVVDCARQAYAKYVSRMDREPAPMHADFARQIALGQVHVAIADNAIVGYAVFYPEGDHTHLENVAVLPSCAGRGIGRHLIEHVENEAQHSGSTAVELYTNEAMTENLAMYPHLGYEETHRAEQDGFKRVYYRKALA